MKSLILLSIIIIGTNAGVGVWKFFQKCPRINGVSYTKEEFAGKYHSVARAAFFLPIGKSCSQMKMTDCGDYHAMNFGGKNWMGIKREKSAKIILTNRGEGRIKVECDKEKMTMEGQVILKMDNAMVLFFCKELIKGINHLEYLMVISRDPKISKETLEKIRSKLEKMKVHAEKMWPQPQEKCFEISEPKCSESAYSIGGGGGDGSGSGGGRSDQDGNGRKYKDGNGGYYQDGNGGKYRDVNSGNYQDGNGGKYHDGNGGNYQDGNGGKYQDGNGGKYHDGNGGNYRDRNIGGDMDGRGSYKRGNGRGGSNESRDLVVREKSGNGIGRGRKD